MDAFANTLGYDNLQVISPYPLMQLAQLQIICQPNEHATLYYTGVIPEGKSEAYIEKAAPGDAVEVVESANGKRLQTLFAGQVSRIGIKNVAGVAYLEVEAVSWTFELDVTPKSRSFQNQQLRYTALCQQVIAGYRGAELVNRTVKDRATGQFILQYLETDWQFLKRVASHLGVMLLPDATQAAPRFYLGLPDGKAVTVNAVQYEVAQDLAYHARTAANHTSEVTVADFTCYSVASKQYFNLGAAVTFKGKKLRVAKTVVEMKDGLLTGHYILAPEAGFRQPRIYNPLISGASLEGQIIDRAKDTVKLRLLIDAEQPQTEACWFPYASFYTSEGNGGWYCMPELGDHVRLYFSDEREEGAIVNGSVRKGGQSTKQTADPSVKSFSNSSGQGMVLDDNGVSFSSAGQNGAAALQLCGATGVVIESDQDLLIQAVEDWVIQPTAESPAPKKIEIKALEGIYLSCKESSIICDGSTDIAGTVVKYKATGPPPSPPPPQPEAPAAKGEDAAGFSAMDGVQLGLDVLGLVPVLGAPCDLINAGISAFRGDWAGAGLSLLGAVPVLGEVAVVGKLGFKGFKFGSKAAKAAKAADKVGAAQKLMKQKLAAAMDQFKKMRQRMFRNMKPGTLKCKILRAEPVDAVVGEVVVNQEDWLIPGRIPIEWQRHYGSRSRRRGVCGYGWETPADARLELLEDGCVIFHDGTGAPSYFDYLPDLRPVMEPVDGGLLQKEAQHYTVRLKTGLIYSFPLPAEDFSGELLVESIGDLSGNTLCYLRDANGLREIVESAGRRIAVTSRQGRIEKMQLLQPLGEPHLLVRYEYNQDGELLAACDALGGAVRFDYRKRLLTKHTHANGVSFYYEYDRYTPEGKCLHAWGDGGLYEYRFDYNEAERCTTVTDSLGGVSYLHYDERYLMTQDIDALGGVTCFEYDEAGRTTAVVDPDGRRTEYTYDQRGNLIKLTRPDGKAVLAEFNELDRPVQVIDPNGAVWRQEWNAQGLLTKQVSPLGAEIEYRYDSLGQPVALIDALKHRTELAFDDYGNLRQLTDALGSITQLKFDLMGNLTTRIDPLRQKSSYTYDAKGRLVKANLPGDATIVCGYDGADNLISYQDEAGKITRLEYCGLNELKRRIQPDGQTVEYQYDTEERLIAVINQRGERYELQRDLLGRIVAEVDYWGQERRYTYSVGGQLQQSCDPLGRLIQYRVDPLGRIVEKAFADPWQPDQTQTERFSYDANGNLIGCENSAIRIAREYDFEGKLLKESQGKDYTVSYEYDRNGNLIARTTATRIGGTDRTHTVRYGYDAVGQSETIEIPGRAPIRQHRNALGQVTWEELGSGLKRNFGYSPEGYLLEQQLCNTTGMLFKQEYSYDRTGNLIKKVDSVWGTEKFHYDPLGRLIGHVDPQNRLKRYLSDPAGDLLQTKVNTSGAEVAGNSDWYRQGEYEKTTYRFDRAGNLTTRQAARAAAEFIWDANQRLVASIVNGQRTVYTYDPLGRRVGKQTEDKVTRFSWDGDALLGDLQLTREANGDFSVVGQREWIYQPGTFEPLAMVRGEELYLYHNDPNGCPTRLLEPTGKVVWAAQYEAWGKVRKLVVDEVDQPLRLQGQYHDGETGLYYNRFRYYEPNIGAFVSQDPLGLAAGENVYAYASNVWKWADPLGLSNILVNPNSVNFSQRSVSVVRTWDPNLYEPIRVMDVDGQLVSYDNRRLLAAQNGGVNQIEAELVKPNDIMPGSKKTWGEAFDKRLNDKRNVSMGEKAPKAGWREKPELASKVTKPKTGC